MYVIEIEVQFGGQSYAHYVDAPAPDAFDFALSVVRARLSTRELRWASLVIV